MIEDSKKTFGPDECWCTQGGQVFWPCKKNKLCKETNEKFQKMKQKYLKSKTYKKYKERRAKQNLEWAKKWAPSSYTLRKRREYTKKLKALQKTLKRKTKRR